MKYRELYNNCKLVLLVSVVVTLDKTSVFQTFFASLVKVESVVPEGICELTFSQAWADDIKDIPTLETTVVVLKLNTAPSRVLEEADLSVP